MGQKKLVKYSRRENIRLESGATVQVIAQYEGEEPNQFEGKQPIAWFRDTADARRMSNLRGLDQTFRAHLERLSGSLDCAANLQDIENALAELKRDLNKTRLDNQALRDQRANLEKETGKLRDSVEQYFQQVSIILPKQ